MAPIDYNDPNDPWRTPGYDPYKGMSDKQKFLASLGQVIGIVLGTVVAMILCALLFSSCTTTQYVPVIEHKTDTVYQNKVKHDSIWQHDSVQIMIKGDSVTIDRWHTKYVSKEVHDTTYISKTDSVPVPYPVEVKVEKELNTWQSFRMTLGTIALCMLAVYVVYRIIRKKLFPPAL